MKNKKSILLLALFLPLFILSAMVAWQYCLLLTGESYEFSVIPYDPRDLLAGNYLQYQVVYNAADVCKNQRDKFRTRKLDAYVCLQPNDFSYSLETMPDCQRYLKGSCIDGQFYAGIERFFIPEAYAVPLTKALEGRKAKIRVKIDAKGHAILQDFLVDDKPWQEILKSTKKPTDAQ